MACTPRHPFIAFVLRLLPQFSDNAHQLAWNDNVLNSTGPTFLSLAWRLYRQQRGGCSDVFIAPSHWFTPTFDAVHTTRFHTLCLMRAERGGTRPEACDDLHHGNHPHRHSYTVHHWLHSLTHPTLPRPGVLMD